MKTNEPKNIDRITDEEWLKRRWTGWWPEEERQDYLDDLKAHLLRSREKLASPGDADRENLCRSSLEDLEEALAEEHERMRAAYRRAGL